MFTDKINFSAILTFVKNASQECVTWSKEAFTSIKDKCQTINLSSKFLIKKFDSIKESLQNFTSIIKSKISDAIFNIENFFDQSPTILSIYRNLGINDKDWRDLPKNLAWSIVVSQLSYHSDENTASHKDVLLKGLAYELNTYIKNNTEEDTTNIKKLLENVEKDIEDLKPELKREEALNKKLNLSTTFTREERALLISQTIGEENLSKEIPLIIGDKFVTIKTDNIPQKQLSGFGKDSDLKQVSSEFQGKTEHASNLWKQNITLGDKQVSFIRSGTTRGNETATKEILANALSLKFSDETISKATTQENALELNFSNVQLMTAGKITANDKGMPFQQMETFKKLADAPQPLKLNYQGKDIFVKLQPPLLFNFGVNVQNFNPIFKPIVSLKENAEKNNTSFKKLFGNLKIFGGENTEKKVNGHYVFDKDSIIAQKLNDPNLDANTKEQIRSLSEQILDIYDKNKYGVKQNPYALPSRVALLTNLLGYATSYGCKSGKDRTGIMSMELENLTAKVITDNVPYDIYNQSVQEKQNLQSIYKSGTAIDIAKINTGNVQRGLKIERLHGLFTSNEERFGVDVAKDFENNLQALNNENVTVQSNTFNNDQLKIIENAIQSNNMKNFPLEEKISWITSENLNLNFKLKVLNSLKDDVNIFKVLNGNNGVQQYIESNVLTPAYEMFNNRHIFYNQIYNQPLLNTNFYLNAKESLSIYTTFTSNRFKLANRSNFEALKATIDAIDNIDSPEKLTKFLKNK